MQSISMTVMHCISYLTLIMIRHFRFKFEILLDGLNMMTACSQTALNLKLIFIIIRFVCINS
jgi:hypothetical protein